jgi:hypothetical protein
MTPEEFIARFNPRAFFHFTDTRNVPSIAEHGLCALSEIRRNGITISAPGGNELSHKLDWEKGLASYVHLGFYPEHPMEYDARVVKKRIQETVFIRVTREVLTWEGVRFTSAVSNSSGCRLLSLDEAIEEMDFPVIYDGLAWRDPAINRRLKLTKKYEILVPKVILPEFLTFPNYGCTSHFHSLQ